MSDTNHTQALIDGHIDQCWLPATGMPILPAPSAEWPDCKNLYIASVVYTGGDTQGSVAIAMDHGTAASIAANMFEKAQADVIHDDITDCLGELANVLAGNLKTDFFGNSALSKPLVMQASIDFLLTFAVEAIYQKVFVTKTNDPIVIQICETE